MEQNEFRVGDIVTPIKDDSNMGRFNKRMLADNIINAIYTVKEIREDGGLNLMNDKERNNINLFPEKLELVSRPEPQQPDLFAGIEKDDLVEFSNGIISEVIEVFTDTFADTFTVKEYVYDGKHRVFNRFDGKHWNNKTDIHAVKIANPYEIEIPVKLKNIKGGIRVFKDQGIDEIIISHIISKKIEIVLPIDTVDNLDEILKYKKAQENWDKKGGK